MLSAFEIISKDEFEKASGTSSYSLRTDLTALDGADTRIDKGVSGDVPEGQLHLEWCEFCQAWYLSEYHFGRGEDD